MSLTVQQSQLSRLLLNGEISPRDPGTGTAQDGRLHFSSRGTDNDAPVGEGQVTGPEPAVAREDGPADGPPEPRA